MDASCASKRPALGRALCFPSCASSPRNKARGGTGVLLAIDTSTALASIALYDHRVLAETTWLAGAEHSRQLLPQVQGLLAMLGNSVADLTGLGVALGPGSFNGLRVGIA